MLDGRFDFQTYPVFLFAYSNYIGQAGIREISLDFKQVSHIDSSALGMILLLREKTEGASQKLVLTNLSGPVERIINNAKLGKTIEIR